MDHKQEKLLKCKINAALKTCLYEGFGVPGVPGTVVVCGGWVMLEPSPGPMCGVFYSPAVYSLNKKKRSVFSKNLF